MDKADSTVALIQLGTKRDATDFQSPRPWWTRKKWDFQVDSK
jgi:hypothetical protein